MNVGAKGLTSRRLTDPVRSRQPRAPSARQ